MSSESAFCGFLPTLDKDLTRKTDNFSPSCSQAGPAAIQIGLNRHDKGPVFRAVQPLPQCGQNRRFVAPQQRWSIEPQAGKDGALEHPSRLRENFLIFALPQFPPDQALLAGYPLKNQQLAPQMSPCPQFTPTAAGNKALMPGFFASLSLFFCYT